MKYFTVFFMLIFSILLSNAQMDSSLVEKYIKQAVVLRDSAQYVSAIKRYEQVLKIYEDAQNTSKIKESKEAIVDIYNRLIVEQHGKGQFSESIKSQKTALRLLEDIHSKNHPQVIAGYFNLGVMNMSNETYQEALDNLNKTLQLQKSVFKSSEHAEMASTYTYIGTVYGYMYDYDKALFFLEKALNIQKQQTTSNQIDLATSYINTARILRLQEKFEKALTYDVAALEQIQKAPANYQQYLGYIYNNIGLDYNGLKQYSAAIDYLKKGLKMQQNYLPPNHPSFIQNYGSIAFAYFDAKDYQKALASINKAIEIDAYPTNDVLLSHTLKAKIYNKLYRANQQTSYLDTAFQQTLIVDSLIQLLRTKYKDNEDQITFSKYTHQAIEVCTKTCYLLKEATQDSKYTVKAFDFFEKSKAHALLQSIHATKALKYANIPDPLLNQENQLKKNIDTYQKQILAGSPQKDLLEKSIFDTKKQYRKLISKLEKDYPQYYQLKYQQQTKTLKEVQKTLKEETALISYFVGDSTLFIIALGKDNKHFYQFPKETSWEQDFQNFRKSIASIDYIAHPDSTQQAYDLYTQKAHSIYQTILEKPLSDLGNKIKHLIIIPDEKLNYIPFELLLSQLPKITEKNYKNLDYLLRQYSFSYGYAAALLSAKQKQSNSTYGGFAPIYKNDLLTKLDSLEREQKASNLYTLSLRDGLDDLPFARQSISDIAKSLNGTTFLGEDATKSNFLKKSKDFGILHLAMHGIVDDENPLDSKLVFTPSPKDSTNHLLRAAELYNVELNADLAVLSACNTGFGKISKGEGVMSISRAFTYAGCPSLVMSLWSVPDASTAQVTTSFFENLKLGQTKDKALQQAKLSYLKDAPARLAHPIYWAGFVPVGDMQTLGFPTRSFSYLWGLLVFLGIGLLGYFGWRKFN